MFKLVMERSVEWLVTINVPKDGGAVDKRKVHVTYKLPPTAKVEELQRNDDGTPEKDWLLEVTTNWRDEDFQAEDGQPMPFSKENLMKVLAITYARAAFHVAFMEAAAGIEARRKN